MLCHLKSQFKMHKILYVLLGGENFNIEVTISFYFFYFFFGGGNGAQGPKKKQLIKKASGPEVHCYNQTIK